MKFKAVFSSKSSLVLISLAIYFKIRYRHSNDSLSSNNMSY